jgi:hypothetical protein
MFTIQLRRRLALVAVAGAVLTVGATLPAAAAKAPSFVLDGGDHWFTHDVGWFPVVQGPAELQLKGKATIPGTLSATIQPDDHTMPAPSDCEPGLAFVFVEAERRAGTFLTSAGDICGHHPQEPTSVVTHSFTGRATIEAADRRHLEGRTGFLEIRMALDGRAHVFASAQ